MRKIVVLLLAACLLPVLAEENAAASAAPAALVWKSVDNKKGHLFGCRLTDGDLVRQPIVIAEFDPEPAAPALDSAEEPEETKGKGRAKKSAKKGKPAKGGKGGGAKAAIALHLDLSISVVNQELRFQVVTTPVKPIKPGDLPAIIKSYGKVIAFAPCYADFGLVTPPENKEKRYPFYYAVDMDGKVAYSGYDGREAIQCAVRDAKRHESECTPILGYYKPTVHGELIGELKFGQSVLPALQKLKPFLAEKKESEARTDALAIVAAIDQSKAYWYKQCAFQIAAKPPTGAILCHEAMKTFPQNKDLYLEAAQKVESNPQFAKAVKIYQQILAIKQKMPESKGEITKAYKLVLTAEKALAKAKKELAGGRADVPVTSLSAVDTLVSEVKMLLESQGAK